MLPALPISRLEQPMISESVIVHTSRLGAALHRRAVVAAIGFHTSHACNLALRLDFGAKIVATDDGVNFLKWPSR